MRPNARAEAFAPATMGNVGIGFDILGLAFERPGDTVVAELREEPGAVILDITGDNGELPREAERNVATIAANHVLRTIGAQYGVGITLKKGLPVGSGMGSSAASAVAAAFAVNALFHEPLSREELLPACLEGEAAASGSYHADNVGPALLGGITLITGTSIEEIRSLPVPDDLRFALVKANVSVSTAAARAALPKQVSLAQMVAQTGAVARFIDALYRGDLRQMAMAMEQDQVAEPARAHLMPLLDEVRTAAKQAGALALVISGAGPTLCAVCDHPAVAESVARTMQRVYHDAGVSSSSFPVGPSREGARILHIG